MNSGGARRPPAAGPRNAPPPPYEFFEERRKYPRVPVGRAGTVTVDGAALRCVIHDISPDGLQIRCDRATMQAIRPGGRAIREDTGPVVTVSFDLATAARRSPVSVQARVYYFVLLKGEKPLDVAFGARFLALEAPARECIDAYIRDMLRPVEDDIAAQLDEPRTVAEIAARLGLPADRIQPALNRLREAHRLLELPADGGARYVLVAAALRSLFERLALLELRLRAIEETLGRR